MKYKIAIFGVAVVLAGLSIGWILMNSHSQPTLAMSSGSKQPFEVISHGSATGAEQISKYSDGYAVVSVPMDTNGHVVYKYVDLNGNYADWGPFSFASAFDHGFAFVLLLPDLKSGKQSGACIDVQGRYVIGPHDGFGMSKALLMYP